MYPFSFQVSLRIKTKMIDPTLICQQLGLQPKGQRKIGDRRITNAGKLLSGCYEVSYCYFDFVQHKDEHLAEMLERITDSLYKHKQLFVDISKDEAGESEFFIGWFSSRNCGEVFEHTLMGKLAELRINLSLDVYGDSWEEEDATEDATD